MIKNIRTTEVILIGPYGGGTQIGGVLPTKVREQKEHQVTYSLLFLKIIIPIFPQNEKDEPQDGIFDVLGQQLVLLMFLVINQ